MSDREPGGWELRRAIEQMHATLNRIEERMVPRPEFEFFKQEQARRLRALDDRITTVQGAKSTEHGRLESKLEKFEDERKSLNNRVLGALGVAGLALAAQGIGSALGW